MGGACVCLDKWMGADCDEPVCQHGKASKGVCICNKGFKGDFCDERSCPDDCNGNGGCLNGTCVCKQGYVGEACAKKGMPQGRAHKCGVHCVRKCLRVSDSDFKSFVWPKHVRATTTVRRIALIHA